MALTAKLEFRQSQQLVMTPRLQQAIRLLQLSNLELNAFIDTELERNPLLERDAEDDSPVGDSSDAVDSGADAAPPTDSQGDDWLDLTKPRTDAAGSLDVDLGNVFPDAPATDFGTDNADSGWASVRQRRNSGDDDTNFEAFVSADVSLKDHFAEQLQLNLSDPVDRLIGQFLIDLVDEAGYIAGDIEAVAMRLGASVERVEQVLGRLQTFDPPGVFARTLAECLALQLQEQNRYDPLIESLLANLPLLAAHNLPALRRAVGVDMNELAEMIGELKRLDPKPGLRFGSIQIHPVVPDVLVRPANDGSWIVELNADTLPKVLVNRTYYSRVSKTAGASCDKHYLLNCLQTANWLVKSLDQRARTILRVSEEIVRQQDGFFSYCVQHL